MIIKEGTEKKKFIEALEEMDELTNMDSFVKPGEELNFSCVRKNGHLTNWKIKSNNKKLHFSKPFSKGKSYVHFMNTLEEMDEEVGLMEGLSFTVLSYLSTDVGRDFEGNIVSHWVELEPGNPYSIVNNTPVFKTKTVTIEESDFKLLTQTGICFYCKETDIYYPLTEVSMKSIGRLLDASVAFNRLDDHPLASAMLLAEKFTYTNKLKVLHRSKNKKVRPVISAVGQKYAFISQKMFFETCFSEAARIGLFKIRKWSVGNELSKVDLTYPSPWNEYTFGFEIQMSDISSIPSKITSYALVHSCKITLTEATLQNKKDVCEEDIRVLFNGVEEEMYQFEDAFAILEHRDCYFKSSDLDDINHILGKTKVKELEPIPDGVYPGKELFYHIIDTRYCNIKEYQCQAIRKKIKDLFFTLAENVKIEKSHA